MQKEFCNWEKEKKLNSFKNYLKKKKQVKHSNITCSKNYLKGMSNLRLDYPSNSKTFAKVLVFFFLESEKFKKKKL